MNCRLGDLHVRKAACANRDLCSKLMFYSLLDVI